MKEKRDKKGSEVADDYDDDVDSSGCLLLPSRLSMITCDMCLFSGVVWLCISPLKS